MYKGNVGDFFNPCAYRKFCYVICKFADRFMKAIVKETLRNMRCQRFFRQNNCLISCFLHFSGEKKIYFHPKCFNSSLSGCLKACLFPLVTKVFIIPFIFLKTKCWLQHEVTITLDSTVVRREWQENFVPASGERFGLTCTVRWSYASEEGSEAREPSHPVNSAFSSCWKVGGWTCGPVFETAGSRNPLQGTSAKLRTVGKLVGSLAGSLLGSSPETQEVRPFFPTPIMADLLRSRAQPWQGASSSSWVMTNCCSFFLFFVFFLLKPCWRLITIATTHFFW